MSFSSPIIQLFLENERDSIKSLYDGLADIDKHEPGTLSIILIEENSNEDVTYVMARFADKTFFDAHMEGIACAKVGSLVKEVVELREGGMFKEFQVSCRKMGNFNNS